MQQLKNGMHASYIFYCHVWLYNSFIIRNAVVAARSSGVVQTAICGVTCCVAMIFVDKIAEALV